MQTYYALARMIPGNVEGAEVVRGTSTPTKEAAFAQAEQCARGVPGTKYFVIKFLGEVYVPPRPAPTRVVYDDPVQGRVS